MTPVTPEEPDPAAPGSLAVSTSRRGWRIAAYAALALVLLAALAWVTTHPEKLPTSDETVRAQTPVGQPVFVGVFGAPADFGRTLHVSGVRVFASSTADVRIVPLVCHGGSVHVTTTPQDFCREVGPTEGATLQGGDAVVLEVVGDAPAVVEIDRVRIAYRDGIQWATQDAGAPSEVSVLPR